jgi:hypothetical protein
VRAIVDRVGGDAVEARAIWQAHEIDGTMALGSRLSAVGPGDILEVRVDGVENDYDLTGAVLRVVTESRGPRAESRPRRPLPLATTGSYGR